VIWLAVVSLAVLVRELVVLLPGRCGLCCTRQRSTVGGVCGACWRAARVLLALVLTACASPPARVVTGTTRGHGAIVDGQVVTAAHVVPPGASVLVDAGRGWEPAWPVARDARTVRLELLRPLAGGEARRALPGDSGTPLVAADGRVLGVLDARLADGRLLVVPVE
jgi:S1-C subfamily serine protease